MANARPLDAVYAFDDLAPKRSSRVLFGQSLEFFDRLLPGHWARRKAPVVALLDHQLPRILEADAHTARKLFRESIAQILRTPDVDLLQERLDVVGSDALRHILLRQNFSVKQRDRDQVWQAVVGLLFRPDDRLVAFLATADNAKRHIED